ncbi:MAG: hypothetical protein J6J23_02085, partial [Clostridia bacterium]|nr:hypothetical protein [Clostridia bacterium]
TWPSGVSASARVNYTNGNGVSTYTTVNGGSSAAISALTTKSVTISNITMGSTKLAYVDYWNSTSSYNTTHNAGTNPSTSGFTVISSASGTRYVTLVFAYCNNSALLQYDSSKKYFYFEDGQCPQTYAGDSTNTTLNNWYTSNSSAYSMYVNAKTVYVYNYNGIKYARIQAPKTATVSISTGSKSFSSGTYYWFKVEPIRWRVSNLNVSSTSYPTGLTNRGVASSNKKVVSDLVLDWAPIDTGTTLESWSYKSSADIHSQIYSTNNTNLSPSYKGTGSYSFDSFTSGTSNIKVTSSTSSMSGIVQASESDIRTNLTDLRAYASDVACMLAGVASSSYCDYWTRDLTTLKNGKYVTSTGITRNRWLSSACGIRLAYTLSSVARTRD